MGRDEIAVDFPDWALMYLVYGDDSGMSDADRETVDAWLAGMREDGYDYDVTDEHNEFCGYPEFGLACSTTKVLFFKRKGGYKMDNEDIMKAYVIQDCIFNSSDSDGCCSFRCDANVRLSLAEAAKEAWRLFAEHYSRISGSAPDDVIKSEFSAAMAREAGKRCYERGASETESVTVEILERSVK